jgi:hypothetical protein
MSTKRPGRNSNVSKASYNRTQKITIPDYEYLIYDNHYIGLRKKSRFSGQQPFYYINPIELNSGLLQFLCNTNKLTFCEAEDYSSKPSSNKPVLGPKKRTYMNIADFPAFICEESYENRVNSYEFTSILENAGFDRARHQREFASEQPIFTVNGVDTNTGEEVIIRQNVNYVANIGKLLRTRPSGNFKSKVDTCELDENLIHEIVSLPDGTECHIIGFPIYNSRQLFKEPELFEYLMSDEYRRIYSELDTDYVNLLKQITGRDDIHKIEDAMKGGEDYFRINNDLFKYEISATFPGNKKIVSEIEEVIKKNFSGLFTRPDIDIQYQFYVLDSDYYPLIYNIRELRPGHLPILTKIKDIIEIEIPAKFGILKAGETRYKNIYEYCKYGDLFSVRTLYIHPGSSPAFYSHEYLRSITLEEVIFSLGLPADINFWANIEYTYNVKNYRIEYRSKPRARIVTETANYLSGRNLSGQKLASNKTTLKKSAVQKYVPPQLRQGAFKVSSGKYYKSGNAYKKKDDYIRPGDKIINCKQQIDKSYEVIFWNAMLGKYYRININPVLRDINYNELLPVNGKYERTVYYSCGNLGRIYGLKSLVPVFEITKMDVCIPENKKKYFITQRNFWGFPAVKQPLPNYEFLDRLYRKYGIESFSQRNSLLLQNKFHEPIDSSKSLDTSNDKCEFQVCSQDEMKDYGQYSFKHILIDGYKIVVNLVPKRSGGTEKKYVCWVYKIDDKTDEIGPNMTRNITFIPGNDLLKIFTVLAADKDMYKDPNGPQPHNMYINLISGEPNDMLHIHILSDNEIIYKSAQYEKNYNIQTETRAIPVYNIIPKLKLYPNYFMDLRKQKINILFNVVSLHNI